MMKKQILIITILFLLASCAEEVALPVVADFTTTVIDDDYSVPVHVAISNTTEGADDYLWTFEGASPATSTDRHPGTITYTTAGTYSIRLEGTNRDDSFDSKERTITIYDAINATFETTVLIDNYPPMEVALNNTSTGGTSYSWTFTGATPSASSDEVPANIVYNEPGDYDIVLAVSNGIESFEATHTVTVVPHLVANFDYELAFEDDDMQVPLTITINNTCISATSYIWTVTGAIPSTSTAENPSFVFDTPGTYTISLEATNGKETQTSSQEITVLANTNLRSFENIHLGINTAHTSNTIGAFFSTTLRDTFSKDEVTASNGSAINIAFYGLNSSFTYNKFISPDNVNSLGFDVIPSATHTKFINKQEASDSSATLSEAQFDAMTDDTVLNALVINETTNASAEFDNTVLPRIVLFETQDGRKGAIKIKEYSNDGTNSYINVDIKVMKE